MSFNRLVPFLALLVSGFTFFGWVEGIRNLASWVPWAPEANPLSLLSLAIFAAAIWLLEYSGFAIWAVRGVHIATLTVLGLLCLILLQENPPLRLVQLLDSAHDHEKLPSPATAIGLLGLGSALYSLPRRPVLAQYLAFVPITAAVGILATYSYGPKIVQGMPKFSSMSLPTISLFLMLSTVLVRMAVERASGAGPLSVLMRKDLGGQAAKILLLTLSLLPFLTGNLRHTLQGQGLSFEQASALIPTGHWILLVGIVLFVCSRLSIATRQLVESERRFRLAASAGRIFAFEWNARTDTVLRSESCKTLMGFGSRDRDVLRSTGYEYFQRIHPHDQRLLAQAIQSLTPENPHYKINYRYRRHNADEGAPCWCVLEESGEAEFDAGGLLRVRGITADVTERVEAQNALKRSETRLRLATDALGAVVYEWDIPGGKVWRSEGLYGMLGFRPDEASQSVAWWRDLINPADAERALRALQTHLENRSTHMSIKYRIRHRMGHELWILDHASIEYDEAGEPARLVGCAVNIDELKRTEEALRLSEERLRRAAQAAQFGTYDYDLTGATPPYWSPELKALFGRQVTDPVPTEAGSIASEVLHEDRKRLADKIALALNPEGDGILEDEHRIRQPDGSIRWVLVKGLTLFEDAAKGGGSPRLRAARLTGTVLDITERKAIEGERERLLVSERTARATAERAARLKDEFLATLSHELRTPLNGILGWCHLLRRDQIKPELLKDGLASIERSAKAQARLVDDLLDMSRITSGKLRLDMQPINPHGFVEDALSMVRPAALEKEIALTHSLDPRATAMLGDAARLQQVVWTLLHNAIKFTPKGGSITLTTARERNRLAIHVVDSGKGIRPEFLPDLFQQFRQADSSTTRKFGGLGLGLAISHSIVELHGGEVTVQSAGEGLGAHFTVRLPAPILEIGESVPTEPSMNHEEQRIALLESSLVDIRILIVDDDRDSCDVLKRMLSELNAHVVACFSAQDALTTLAQESFDLLMSDISMPEMDGHDLIHAIRKLGNHIPAVALTALTRPDDYAKSMESGFCAHLSKPVNLHSVIETILHVVKGERADKGGAGNLLAPVHAI